MVHPPPVKGGLPPPFTFIAREGFNHPNARVDVRLLGPCFKTGRLRPLRQRPGRSADLGRGWPHFTRGYNTPPWRGATFPVPLGDRPSRRWPARGGMHPPDGGLSNLGQVWSQALPFQQFHVLFDSLSKVLFIFRSLYLCAIGLRPIFSFRRNLPPV